MLGLASCLAVHLSLLTTEKKCNVVIVCGEVHKDAPCVNKKKIIKGERQRHRADNSITKKVKQAN